VLQFTIYKMENIIISLRNVSVRFGDTDVLKGLNLDVKQGESLVIVGSSGCGKTVLLKTILGLIPIKEGEIYLFGERINGAPKNKIMELRSRVGMVFQSSALFDSLTVWENVGFYYLNHSEIPDEKIRSLAIEILKDVGMEGFENFLPEQLSGGMKKRVSIARALISKPEIIFYDEPTTGLDPIMAESITRLIMDMHKKFKTTDITVTHDIKLASMISDRIALIDNGTIEEIGTFQELREKSKSHLIRSFLVMEGTNEKG
ncbi:MAG: ATP-binding cassette domain-containing protein, partial [Candidatus Omnitrophica bacterium]|nr:ATP-binding cassette domain-containing protein [Candidatus Omnitrophota bacterium]